jgi:protein-arginine kinase activator protein McsA
MALYQHPRLKNLADEINEILPVEKRCGAAKKIIDLEVAVQREDYQAAAELREDLRKLNNITWIYLRGNQVNPFDD